MTTGTELTYRESDLRVRIPSPRTPPRERGSPARGQIISDPVSRARRSGVTAAWTGPYGGTVELARLGGPHTAVLTDAEAVRFHLPGHAPHVLRSRAVRVAVYETVFARGTQFDFYRWINLRDLAAAWPYLNIPRGISHEWSHVLRAAGLLPDGWPAV